MHLFFDTVPEEKKNTMENMTKERAKEIVAKKYGLGTTLVTGHKASYWEEAMDLVLASGSVAAPKEEPNIDDNPATYTHFDMLAMVARQTKHMFEENTALREALKELLPMAEWKLQSTLYYLTAFSETIETEPEKYKECERIQAIIERARKLLSK